MKGMSSSLKRAKVYFFVIAFAMTFVLFILSYMGNLVEKWPKLNFTPILMDKDLRATPYTRLPADDPRYTAYLNRNDHNAANRVSNPVDSNRVSIIRNTDKPDVNSAKIKQIVVLTKGQNKSDMRLDRLGNTSENEQGPGSHSNKDNVTNKLERDDFVIHLGEIDNNEAIKLLGENESYSRVSSDNHESIQSEIDQLRRKYFEKDRKKGNRSRSHHTNEKKPKHKFSVDNNGQKYVNSPMRDRLRELGLISNVADKHQPTPETDTFPSMTGRPDVCSNCFTTDFNSIINAPDLCGKGDVDLLMVITSSLQNQYARNSIRKTWGKVCNTDNSRIRCIFFFGNRNDTKGNALLRMESERHKDIVQLDFRDSYANLTYKTITALKWSAKYCSSAKYVMKTDDDMYVNTELLPYLIEGAPDTEFIGGHCWGPSSPHRDTSSKWFVSYRQYMHPYFPAMCSGTGYVMSRDTVKGILKMSRNVPFFHLEDVYVAICVNKLGMQPVLLNGFKNEAVEFEPCVYRNYLITSHGYQGPGLEFIWREAHTCPLKTQSPSVVYKPMNFF